MARQVTCGFETGSIDEAGTSYLGSNCTVVNTAGRMRSGTYSLSVATVFSNQGRQWALTGTPAEIYFTFSVYFSAANGNNNMWFRLDEGGTNHLNLDYKNDGTCRLKRDATTLATINVSSGVLHWCKGHALIADNPTGRFEFWIDGVKVFDFTGDTRNAGTPYIDAVIFYQPESGLQFFIDDLKVNDTSGAAQNTMPGDGGILLLSPTGAGTTTQLDPSAGNNWDCVEEVPPSTANYVSSSTADEIDTYALANVPAGYTAVTLVQPLAYAALAVAGTGAVRNVIRSGGTDYADAADKTCTTTYAFKFGDVRYADPADSAAWTTTKVNALELGVQVK